MQDDEDFKKIRDLLRKRKNVLVEGPAGTGKSTLLRKFKKEYDGTCVVVAPTGIASLNVQGQTIHSAFRLPLGYLSDSTASNINDYLIYFYNTIRLLIIDEISMVRSDILDAVDMTLRQARSDMNPFGGVKVLMFGDSGQLPPVVTGEEKQFFSDYNHLFYKSNAFILGNFEVVKLEKVYRQSDPFFIGFLNKVRLGTAQKEDIDAFHEQVTISKGIPHEDAVILCTTRAMASKINAIKFEQIDERPFSYNAVTEGFKPNEYPTEEVLQLKIGSKVMMLNNDREGRWVNGTIGYVTNLSKTKVSVSIRDEEYDLDTHTWEKFTYKVRGGEIQKEVTGRFRQYPVKLSWGATVHKSQGLTLEKMHLDLTHPMFEVGQLYVALSRARSIEGLSLSRRLEESDIIPNPYIL